MRTFGPVDTGLQMTATDEVAVVAGGTTTSTHNTTSVTHAVLANNKSTIDINTEVPADTNCVLAGPITVGASATLTVAGTLTII